MIIKSNFCQGLLEKELVCFKDYDFTLWGDNRPTDEELKQSPVNIYYHSEPDEYFGNHQWIGQNYQKFDAVLTWNKDLLRYCPNTVKTLFGTSAFHDKITYPEPAFTIFNKQPKVTFIRGNKHHNVKGHHIRWELWNRQNEIKNFEKEFYATTTPEYASSPEEETQWFDQRKLIFKLPMFHIAIENTSNENYFTEKIMDTFIFESIPIYFGCPNIRDYFNPDGIIQVNSTDEIIDVCNKLTPDDYYNRQFAAWDNQKRCQQYLNLGKTVRETLKTIFDEK